MHDLAVAIIAVAAVAATLFPLIYGFTAPWLRSLVGRGLMTSQASLALLLDEALLGVATGGYYPGREYVQVTIYALICVGAWLLLTALVTRQIVQRKASRA